MNTSASRKWPAFLPPPGIGLLARQFFCRVARVALGTALARSHGHERISRAAVSFFHTAGGFSHAVNPFNRTVESFHRTDKSPNRTAGSFDHAAKSSSRMVEPFDHAAEPSDCMAESFHRAAGTFNRTDKSSSRADKSFNRAKKSFRDAVLAKNGGFTVIFKGQFYRRDAETPRIETFFSPLHLHTSAVQIHFPTPNS